MDKNNLLVDRNDRIISMSRVFHAPRELVWKVYTDPDLVPRWWGPRYLTTVGDKMDLRIGGVWRYIQKDAQGNEYAFNGVYKAVHAPERLVYTFEFEPMPGHITTDMLTFEELPDGKTRITAITTFDTLEDLEGMLQSGMEGGAVESWDRLEEFGGGMVEFTGVAASHGVKIIEDCCEALGAKYQGEQVGATTTAGTYSFHYPSHQITALGGRGMVVTNDKDVFKKLRTLRDWGKMSNWDKYEQNNTSYSMDVDGVAYFPHYVYETVGYNMKLPEANAAFGREQLKRLDGFVGDRKRIHDYIADGIRDIPELLIHEVPVGAEPSWFGVVLTLINGDRDKLGNYLETMGIRHRPFFAGNITRHPPFSGYKQAFPVADYLMENSMFVGCWPRISRAECDYMIEHIHHGVQMAMK